MGCTNTGTHTLRSALFITLINVSLFFHIHTCIMWAYINYLSLATQGQHQSVTSTEFIPSRISYISSPMNFHLGEEVLNFFCLSPPFHQSVSLCLCPSTHSSIHHHPLFPPPFFPPFAHPSALYHCVPCRKWWRTTTLYATWMRARRWAMPRPSAPTRLAPSPPTAWLLCRLT